MSESLYLSDGPGKTRTQNITGYPIEISGTELNHTVVSLSKTLLTKMYKRCV